MVKIIFGIVAIIAGLYGMFTAVRGLFTGEISFSGPWNTNERKYVRSEGPIVFYFISAFKFFFMGPAFALIGILMFALHDAGK